MNPGCVLSASLMRVGLILDLVPLYVATAVFVELHEGLLDGLFSFLGGLELPHVLQKAAVVENPCGESQTMTSDSEIIVLTHT